MKFVWLYPYNNSNNTDVMKHTGMAAIRINFQCPLLAELR